MDRCLYHRSTIHNSPPESPEQAKGLNYLSLPEEVFPSGQGWKLYGKLVCGSAQQPVFKYQHRFSVVEMQAGYLPWNLLSSFLGQLTSDHSEIRWEEGGEVAYFCGQRPSCLYFIAEGRTLFTGAELELPGVSHYRLHWIQKHLFITGGRTPSLVPGRLWLPNTVHERQVPSGCLFAAGCASLLDLTSELTPWLTGEVGAGWSLR